MDLSQQFTQLVKQSADFQEALDIVKTNARGDIYLMGGFLYRTLASIVHGVEKPPCDLDFLVEQYLEINPPTDWVKRHNKFNNPKFVKGERSIDIVPIATVESIVRRRLDPTIENFLTGTPLTIQSMVYSIWEQKIYGDVGLEALHTKTVAVNNYPRALLTAQKKGILVNELVRKKAASLQFEYKL